MRFETNGLALTTGYKYQLGGLVRPDGTGGAIVLWSDVSSGSIGLMGQHVTDTGGQSWDADGLQFFFGIDGDANNFKALSWGADKAMLFWEDKRWSSTGAVAMGQVMNRNAAISYTMDGIALSENEEQKSPIIAKDGQGGAYLAYTNISSGTEILFAQHINADLAPTWPGQGFQVNPNALFGQLKPTMIAGPDGYMYFFWTEEIFLQGLSLFTQKYDIDGNAQWSVGGIQLDAGDIAGDKYAVTALSMTSGEIILVWEAETVDGTRSYISQIMGDGSVNWTHPVSAATGNQRNAFAIYDEPANLIHVAWEDQRDLANSGVDLYAISVNGSGELGQEQLLSNDFGDQTRVDLSIADDGSGVLYAAWQSFDGFQNDVFVKNLTTDTEPEQITTLETENWDPAIRAVTGDRFLVAWADGRPGIYTDVYMYDSEPGSAGHAENGIAVSSAVLNQMEPQIIPFADNSTTDMAYLIAWQDMRSSGKTELTNIYAQAYTGVATGINPEPQLVSDFKLGAAYPNPFNGSVTIPFSNPAGEALVLRIHDILGREIHSAQLQTAGQSVYTWTGQDLAGSVVSSGVYLVSVESASQRHSQKLMFLK